MEKPAMAPSVALDLPRLKTRTAYGRVIGLVVVLWGLEMFDEIVHDFLPGLTWIKAGWSRTGVIIAASGLWLLWLAYRHKRPWWQCLVAGMSALIGLMAIPITSERVDIPLAVLETILEIILIGAVAKDAGISPRLQLGYRPQWATNRAGHYQGLGVFLFACAGFAASNAVQLVLSLVPGVPQMDKSQIDTLGYKNMADLTVWAIMAGPHEELILTGALAIFLLAARRPIWEISIIAAVLRIIPHMYFGFPSLAVAVFAVWNICLYARSRRIVPIVAAHVITNIAALLAQMTVPLSGVVFMLCVVSIALTAQGRVEPKTIKIPRYSTK